MPPTLADNLATRSQTLGQSVISDLSRWYGGGVFYQNTMTAWYLSTLAPAALMATLAKYATNSTLQAKYIAMVVEIVNRVIAQNVNGANLFTPGLLGAGEGPDQQSGGSTFNDTAAIEATASIGWILYQLPSGSVPAATTQRWLQVCQANCAQLDSAGTHETTYYINGNFNVHLLNAYWFTAVASTGAQQLTYQDMYERALAFILDPTTADPVVWPGYGLIIDVSGAPAFDWSDRQVHLSETNGYTGPNPSPTFDPYYSTLQLDLLSRLFLVNRDFRIMRLINAISNKMEPLINTTTWVINCTGGSRQSLNQGYVMAWYQVQSLLGCKALGTTLLDSTHILAMWDNAIITNIGQNSANGFMAPGTMRQLALCIATTREAANASQIKVTAT